MADSPDMTTTDHRNDLTEKATQIPRLVDSLTIEEKLSLTRGSYPQNGKSSKGALGYLPSVDRLDIPAIRMADGPLGVRIGEATAFPAAIALGATFNPTLANKFGTAIGTEARAKDVDVLLAPSCNLIRVPQCGRNFEYYGEDPCHSSQITVATVRGIQSQGVVSTPKHYVANHQEHERVNMSAEIGERALRELYLPAFEAAVDDGEAGAVMAAFNRVNGTHISRHEWLLTDILKDEFGFDGPVISDWWGVRDGPAAALAGLDIEMPGTTLIHLVGMASERLSFIHAIQERWPARLPSPGEALDTLLTNEVPAGGAPKNRNSMFAKSLPNAIETKELPRRRLNGMVARVLTLHDRIGALEGGRKTTSVNQKEHQKLAKQIAINGCVLLKNESSFLPLDPSTSVAVIGPNINKTKVGGGGSSEVHPPTTTSPIEGICDRSETEVLVDQSHPPIEEHLMFSADFDLSSIIGTENDSFDESSVCSTAAEAGTAVVIVQDTAAETHDRESLALPGDQDKLISTVAAAAEHTIVVLQTAGPVEMPWVEDVDAVLEAWYPGQEAGHAIAAILYGDADPGGRLPVTFAASADDYPTSSDRRYPGNTGSDGYPKASYDESVFVGYRHFDQYDIEPLFPFGHGLSYADFNYRNLGVSIDGETTASVSVTIENTGTRAGREVVQVYVRDSETSVPRPPRELVGFKAISLNAGEVRSVDVGFDDRAFAFYNERKGEWTTESGEFVIEIGRSSRNICATATVEPKI